jgi:hypothetical protein
MHLKKKAALNAYPFTHAMRYTIAVLLWFIIRVLRKMTHALKFDFMLTTCSRQWTISRPTAMQPSQKEGQKER